MIPNHPFADILSIELSVSFPQGRKFLSSLFNLQPALVRELAAIVRNQVPGGRPGVLDAYADILFRAWRDASGACLYEVESTCLQVSAAARR